MSEEGNSISVTFHDFVYDNLYFKRDMELYSDYVNRVNNGENISLDEQQVYNDATARLMQYNMRLEAQNTNIWGKYGESTASTAAVATVEVADDTNTTVDAETPNTDQLQGTLPTQSEEQGYDEQLARQIGEANWNAQYQNIITDIANSRTPAEREQKINFYQSKLIVFQASGIDVGNDIAYLRETQGSSLAQEFKAGVQTFLSTLSSSVEAEYLLSPDNEANVEREPTEQEITNGITRVYDDDGTSMLTSATGIPLSEEILKSDDRERVASQSFLEAIGEYCKELQEQWEFQDNESYRRRAMRELEMFGVRPSDPQYELKLQEHISMLKEIHDSLIPGGMKFVRGLSGSAIKGASKAAEVVGKTGRYTGELVQVNKADIAADLLAQRIGGQSRVKFASDSIGREFDTISVEYIGQTKPALQTLNKSVRDQMKATFDAAQETGKKVYYHFEGKPAQSVIDKLYEYSQRYGVDVVIDMTPLK